MPEECDGTPDKTCVDLGYYGGSIGCTECTFDVTACNACAVTCVGYDPGTVAASGTSSAVVVASGTSLAVVAGDIGYSPWTLTMFDASLNEVGSAEVNDPSRIAGVAGGWLLVDSDVTVQHVDMPGTVTSLPPIANCGRVSGIAYGPGGRALVLCNNMLPTPGSWYIAATILDASGAIVVPPFNVFAVPSTSEWGGVTTDGTSFFVAANGQLALVAPDGTVSSPIMGYPIPGASAPISAVSWSGSTGWDVAVVDNTFRRFVAQAFDANGAMIGPPVSITTSSATDLQAFNSGFVGIQASTVSSAPPGTTLYRYAVTRLDATGAVVASTEVGVGTSGLSMVPFGSDVAAAWSGHLALVTP